MIGIGSFVKIYKDGNEVQCSWDEEFYNKIFLSGDNEIANLAEKMADIATEIMNKVENM